MIAVREPAASELVQVLKLDRQCFGRPWEPSAFERAAAGETGQNLWIGADGADRSDRPGAPVEASVIVGFMVWRCLPPEAELLRIAVEPGRRGSGLGGDLLAAGMALAQQARCTKVWLEVASQNRAARALYLRAGFVEQGLRKGYYAAPADDAVVLEADLFSAPVRAFVSARSLWTGAGPMA